MAGYADSPHWSWAFGMLLVIGLVALAALIVLTVQSLRRDSFRSISAWSPPSERARSHGARQILDERYARGVLSTEEYEEHLAALGLTKS